VFKQVSHVKKHFEVFKLYFWLTGRRYCVIL